jgi:hypothetical protein
VTVTTAGAQVGAEHRYALLASTARQGPDPAANSSVSSPTIRLRKLLSKAAPGKRQNSKNVAL